MLYYYYDFNFPFTSTFEDDVFMGDYIIIRIMIPGFIAININKNFFVSCFYSDKTTPGYMKFFYSIENSMMKDNGMAEMYLFRLYNHFISIFISAILLFLQADISFPYTNDIYTNHLVYNEGNFKTLKLWNTYLSLTIIYMVVGVCDYYNFPKYSDTKQIWDSIFLLHDEKIKEFNGDKIITETMESNLLKSDFVTKTFNSDIQSEEYKLRIKSGENPQMIEKVFNQDIQSSDAETNAVLEDFMLGRDDDNNTKLKNTLMKNN